MTTTTMMMMMMIGSILLYQQSFLLLHRRDRIFNAHNIMDYGHRHKLAEVEGREIGK